MFSFPGAARPWAHNAGVPLESYFLEIVISSRPPSLPSPPPTTMAALTLSVAQYFDATPAPVFPASIELESKTHLTHTSLHSAPHHKFECPAGEEGLNYERLEVRARFESRSACAQRSGSRPRAALPCGLRVKGLTGQRSIEGMPCWGSSSPHSSQNCTPRS